MTTNKNTNTNSPWIRSLNWLKGMNDALGYDGAQYTFDRMTALQNEIAKLASRVEQLEAVAAANTVRESPKQLKKVS